jgi:DNA-binding CsgD family transcriptional regulator
VHWSDGATLELIGHLLRRPPQAAVMVVCAFRTGRADRALAAAIEAAARDGGVEQVALGPLDRAAAERLVGAAGRRDGERLFRASGGNPFYLLQLARSGPSAPAGGDGRARPHEVPPAVSAAIAGELERLSPAARAFGQAAAVAGDPFELDLAVATAGTEEPAALEALDELFAHDLIRAGDVPRRFQFRHPLVRSAVYESCSPGARLAAHQRCARALGARGAAATARAHHVEQSAGHGDAGAVAVLREAGDASSTRDPSSAARWYEAALRLLPDTAPAAERAELLLALAGSWAAVGRLEASRAALLEALALTPPDRTGDRVKLISACAGVEHLLGQHAQARGRLADALAQLADDRSPDAAALMLELAVAAFYVTDYERMVDWSVRSVETASQLDDRPLLAAAAALAAFACTLKPDTIGDARAHHGRAAALVDELSDDALAGRLSALAWLGPAEFYLDLYEQGRVHAERGLAIARATAQGEFFPALTQVLANLLFVGGRPAVAAELLDGVVEAARLSDSALALAWSLLNRCQAANYSGDLDAALRAGEEAMSLTAELGTSPVAAWAGGTYGDALLRSGRPEGAYEVWGDRCGGVEMPWIPAAWRAIWLERMTVACLALGRIDDARRAAGLAEEVAGAYGLPLAAAMAERAAAAVALHAGDARTAVERALASAAGAAEVGAVIDAAYSRALAGRALALLGERDQAVAELERAAAELDSCGAPRLREPVERELRKLGRVSSRRSRRGDAEAKGVAALTGRELELARLIVDRRTNQEIAAELFLSIKTVETHLRNIFRKLDARTRVDVARIVELEERGVSGSRSR